MESSYSISVWTVDDIWAILSVHQTGLGQHRLGLICVAAGTGRQELSGSVKPHPFPKDEQDILNSRKQKDGKDQDSVSLSDLLGVG